MGHLEARDVVRDWNLEVIAASSAEFCILLTGTTSAALEVGRRIHGLGRGRLGRFRVVNCGWPESLLEQQLFHALRPGSSGTLFLEEVGLLSLDLQDRLLEVLNGPGEPKGPRPPRARLIASTSESLYQRALEGSFNERLLYRLNVVHLVVPPDHSDW